MKTPPLLSVLTTARRAFIRPSATKWRFGDCCNILRGSNKGYQVTLTRGSQLQISPCNAVLERRPHLFKFINLKILKHPRHLFALPDRCIGMSNWFNKRRRKHSQDTPDAHAHTPITHDNSDPLAEIPDFTASMRAALNVDFPQEVQDRHLTEMHDALAVITHESLQRVARVTEGETMNSRLFARRGVKVACATIGVLTITSGMAFAGALPDGVQNIASSAGDAVGLSLPDPDDAEEAAQEAADEAAKAADEAAEEAAEAAEEASEAAAEAAEEAADQTADDAEEMIRTEEDDDSDDDDDDSDDDGDEDGDDDNSGHGSGDDDGDDNSGHGNSDDSDDDNSGSGSDDSDDDSDSDDSEDEVDAPDSDDDSDEERSGSDEDADDE